MTKVYVHELKGLKPDVLATYLAALGMLRLLAEQKEANVRGFWRDEHFVLVGELDWTEIEAFLLRDYAPTPILAPWNLESGFYLLKAKAACVDEAGQGDDLAHLVNDTVDVDEADDADQAVGDPLLDRFESTAAPRFASFRRAIEIVRTVIPSELRLAEKASQRAHDALQERAVQEGDQHGDALRRTAEAERVVKLVKAEVVVSEAAAKRCSKESPEHEALLGVKERLKETQQRLKIARNCAKETLSKLRSAQKAAKKDKQLAQRIADTKKQFKKDLGERKDRLLTDLRSRWGAEAQQWIDAAIAIDENGEAGVTALFGSGGNDGRMEYTKNLRYHLHALFDIETGIAPESTAERLRAAVFGSSTKLLVHKAIGQFSPGRAGGANMGVGFISGGSINPWEFVLMLEGAVALVAGMSRRGEVDGARVSSPFWMEGAAAGFGSASEREDLSRGEQWLPVWSQPLRYDELVELVREGRAQVGKRQMTRAADLVRSTARLGVARGIDSLQRFAYLRRYGKMFLAVSNGRFQVASRSHQSLLDEVAPWVDRLVFSGRDKNAPARLAVIARRAQEALFSVCRRDAGPTVWRAFLIVLGEAELSLLHAGKSPTRRPLPRLSRGWLAAIDDGTPAGRLALRLALALASQHRPWEPGSGGLVDSVRRHFLPMIDWDKPRARFNLDNDGRVRNDPEYVCMGRDLVTVAIQLVERRSIWARLLSKQRNPSPLLPLEATRGCEVSPEEIGAWVRGEIPDATVLQLIRPLLALDWGDLARHGAEVPPACAQGGVADPLQMLIRLGHLPFEIPILGKGERIESAVPVRFDPEPLRLLAAGDLDRALRVVISRLGASGLRPVFRRAVATSTLARRLAASLAFPISRQDAGRAARLVCKPYDVKDAEALPFTV